MADLRVSFPRPCGEAWEAMPAVGCNRFCARCDHVVHDLAQHTADEIAALLATDAKVCVRAAVDASGRVQTKPTAGRRVVLGVSAGVLAMSSPAMAGKPPPTDGTIVGTAPNAWMDKVVAAGADDREYRARVKRNGTYKIKHVPPGGYQLRLQSGCSNDEEPFGTVQVSAGSVVTAPPLEYSCVIVGVISLHSSDG